MVRGHGPSGRGRGSRGPSAPDLSKCRQTLATSVLPFSPQLATVRSPKARLLKLIWPDSRANCCESVSRSEHPSCEAVERRQARFAEGWGTGGGRRQAGRPEPLWMRRVELGMELRLRERRVHRCCSPRAGYADGRKPGPPSRVRCTLTESMRIVSAAPTAQERNADSVRSTTATGRPSSPGAPSATDPAATRTSMATATDHALRLGRPCPSQRAAANGVSAQRQQAV